MRGGRVQKDRKVPTPEGEEPLFKASTGPTGEDEPGRLSVTELYLHPSTPFGRRREKRTGPATDCRRRRGGTRTDSESRVPHEQWGRRKRERNCTRNGE